MSTKTTPQTASNGLDTSKWEIAGRNVRFTTLDGVLLMAVNIRPDDIKSAPLSNKGVGPNKTVGSTLGNAALGNTGIRFGVNVFAPPA